MSTSIEARAARSGRRGRGTLAVFAGLLANVIPATLIDQILHMTGVYPPWGQAMSDPLYMLAFGYRLVIAVWGGWLVARLAPDRPVRHAIVLGIIGVVISTAATIATWNKGPEFGPKWYPIALVLISVPASWLGARLYRPR
jgi:hypothetical protein